MIRFRFLITLLFLTLASLISCYSQVGDIFQRDSQQDDLAKAQLGNTEAMMSIKDKLDSYNPDDIPMLYYWTAKLCWKEVLKLEYPKLFMSYLEQNLDNNMMKTTYALCKLVNLEGFVDDNFKKQRDGLLYHNTTPEQYKKIVKESPIYKNIQLGIRLLKECAPTNPYAAQELADYYLRDDAEKDWDKAIKYYDLSLKNDPTNAQALSTLSHCYYHGYGVTQSYLKSIEYWTKLCSLGINFAEWEHSDIRYLLGNLYNEGIGVPQNLIKAEIYFTEGAEDKDADCYFGLGDIAYIKKNYNKSYGLYKRALEVPSYWNNHLKDIYIALSRAHRFGRGVKQNADSASYYWDKAVKLSSDITEQVNVLNLDGSYEPQRIMPEMIFVKGGEFYMGATSEQKPAAYKEEYPIRKISVSDFYIGKYEVTQDEWLKIMGYNPSENKGYNLPVDNVSWIEVKEFIKRLNELTGDNYYLPSEAEWEYAARGGVKSTAYRYIGGDTLDDIAWYSSNSNDTSHPVGSKRPNSLGIYDMAGNVWEWCEDSKNGYGADTLKEPLDGSKVRRGGSYTYFEWGCRAAFRGSANKGYKFSNTGFRLCKKIK